MQLGSEVENRLVNIRFVTLDDIRLVAGYAGFQAWSGRTVTRPVDTRLRLQVAMSCECI